MARQRRQQDSYGERAKREGYPARSVYKLEEIDRRLSLFKKGMRVLDLGASPGSWTLYAAKKVGPQGSVYGVDLHPHEGALPSNAVIEVKDAWQLDPKELGHFDVVMSDMAPKTSGQRAADQYRSYELVMQALKLATQVLKPDGIFVAKIFQGEEFKQAKDSVAKHFNKVRIIRPKATRSESYEVFICGLTFEAPQTV